MEYFVADQIIRHRNGYLGNGYSGNGYSGNGYSGNAYSGNGYHYQQQPSAPTPMNFYNVHNNNNQGNNTVHVNNTPSGPTWTQVLIGVGVVAVAGLAVYVIGPATIISGIEGFFSWLGGALTGGEATATLALAAA